MTQTCLSYAAMTQSSLSYAARKQRAYRERLKARKELQRSAAAAVALLVKEAINHCHAALWQHPRLGDHSQRSAAPLFTTADAAALPTTMIAVLQIWVAFSAGADLLARGLQARFAAEAADRVSTQAARAASKSSGHEK